MNKFYVLAMILLSACSTGDSGFQCYLDTVDGQWYETYTELTGNCGPLYDDTITLDGFAGDGGDLSSDMCTYEVSATYPTSDLAGLQSWDLEIYQLSDTEITGTAVLTLTHPSIVCKSTYEINLKKL